MLHPALFLQAFYLTASAITLVVYLIPPLNTRFLAYGARDLADGHPKPRITATNRAPQRRATAARSQLDHIADIKVPHKWFTHFYVVSVTSSIFWAYEITTHGPIYTYLATFVPDTGNPNPSVQAFGCWALLTMQGTRRLYECLRQPQGSSKMWIGHYAIGIAFYLATGIAIWVEQLPGLKAFHALADDGSANYAFSGPLPFMDVMALWVFTGASLNQSILHRHLRSLKKYTMPTHPTFDRIAAPHYTCECLIYLALAVLSRPNGSYMNHTMATALVFVVVNLGISADGTRKWMEAKFGDGNVPARWRMIPYVW
jgi:3-oxo-5-alpha-steroid 4-dehydrogenase 3